MKFSIGGFESEFLEPKELDYNYSPIDLQGFQKDFYSKEICYEGKFEDALLALKNQLFSYRIFPSHIMNFKIFSQSGKIEKDALIAQRIRLGPICLTTAVRVTEITIATVENEQVYQFSYGTLTGHPEKGEAWFRVRGCSDSLKIKFEMRALSRPGNLLSKLGAPMSRFIQKSVSQKALKNFGANP